MENTQKCKKMNKVILANASLLQKAQTSNKLKVDEIFVLKSKLLPSLLADPLYEGVKIHSVNRDTITTPALSSLFSFAVLGGRLSV